MDMRMCDVIITLDRKYEDKLKEAVALVQKAGVDVLSADDDNSVIEGTIGVEKVRDLEKLDCVKYVRTVFTYDANLK